MNTEPFSHIILILELLNRKSMGRYTLSDKTGLSKARIRSILNSLQTDGYVQTDGKSSGRRGTSLSTAGKEILQEIHQELQFYTKDELTIPTNLLDQKQYSFIAATVVNVDIPLNNSKSIYLRDVAVRAGASGAIICNWDTTQQSFVFPEEQIALQIDISNSLQEDSENKVLIITFGTDEGQVNISAVHVALNLIDLQYYPLIRKFSFITK